MRLGKHQSKVPEARLELASREAYASETYVYTNSTIRACFTTKRTIQRRKNNGFQLKRILFLNIISELVFELWRIFRLIKPCPVQ